MRSRLLTVFIVVFVAACGDDITVESPELEANCDNARPLELTITSSTAASDGTSLRLTGTATDSGLAVRELSIAGIPATKERINYARWSIQLPEEVYADKVADEMVTLRAKVVTACTNAEPEISARLPEALLNSAPSEGGAPPQ